MAAPASPPYRDRFAADWARRLERDIDMELAMTPSHKREEMRQVLLAAAIQAHEVEALRLLEVLNQPKEGA